MTNQNSKIGGNGREICCANKQGAVLLVVLFIVMAITILSLGFLSQSDVELACGENMILRAQMDYLVESGLEHAKGLILNPQDVGSEYWIGATGQQITSGNDYYDVTVVRDDSDPDNRCNYSIDCDAYRLKGGEKVGQSSLRAELRLDPVIALWCGTDTTITAETVVHGDVYAGGNLSGIGPIFGDAFASGVITAANIQGKKHEAISSPPVLNPGLLIRDYRSSYNIGSTEYMVGIIGTASLSDGTILGPTVDNPAGIYYKRGSIILDGDVNINGMLVVSKDLNIGSGSDITITAVKNFPALLVGTGLRFTPPGEPQGPTRLIIRGLAQVGLVEMSNVPDTYLEVVGALISQTGIINTVGCTVNIVASPDRAAIQIWPTPGNPVRWSQAAGAFFKTIER